MPEHVLATYTSQKTLLPHDINAPTQPQLISPASLPENARQANPSRFNQGYLTLALMASTKLTMSLSNMRTDVNDKHQSTNDGDDDVLGGHCRG
jgi:hypothetical protein